MRIATKIENLTNYKLRLQVERLVEEFLENKGYLKINLPVLSPVLIPESYLEVFQTKFEYFKEKYKLYLTPSPELFLKRLLVENIGNCYCLGKSFRNGEKNSSLHHFEFEMLEYYKIKVNYLDLADELLELIQFVAQNQKISLTKWEKLTVAECFQKYAQINEKELFDHKLFLQKAQTKGYATTNFSYEDLFSQIYVQEIEPFLGKNGYPTLIYDYPKEFAALAKLNKNGKTSQRFEFYIAGIELGDCYSELTDWSEQEERFSNEVRLRHSQGKINHAIDKGFIDALKYGLADCAGIAIGFDRLALIFCNVDSIQKLKLINIE